MLVAMINTKIKPYIKKSEPKDEATKSKRSFIKNFDTVCRSGIQVGSGWIPAFAGMEKT